MKLTLAYLKVVHCQSFNWEIRSSSWDIAQYVSHNSPSDSFPTVVPRYFLFGRERNGLILRCQCWQELKLTISLFMRRLRSCISLLKDVFFYKARSWQWLRYWDEHSAVPASSSPGMVSVTSHWIQSKPLHQRKSKVRHVAFRSIIWSTKLYMWSLYDKDHISELRIKNRSESDLHSYEVT